jgi:hypothetical protein
VIESKPLHMYFCPGNCGTNNDTHIFYGYADASVTIASADIRGIEPRLVVNGQYRYQLFEVEACGTANQGQTVSMHFVWHTYQADPYASTRKRLLATFNKLYKLANSLPRQDLSDAQNELLIEVTEELASLPPNHPVPAHAEDWDKRDQLAYAVASPGC